MASPRRLAETRANGVARTFTFASVAFAWLACRRDYGQPVTVSCDAFQHFGGAQLDGSQFSMPAGPWHANPGEHLDTPGMQVDPP